VHTLWIPRRKVLCLLAAGLLVVSMPGCRRQQRTDPAESRRAQADRQVQDKWGKSLDELPTRKLSCISPHNQNIEQEYEQAFGLHHAVQYGQRVEIEWNDVGGGSSRILEYLRNVYSKAETSGIDVVWGGGEDNFAKMAEEGILRPMELTADARENIPARFGGLEMRDPNGYWCGSAISGFGFLYNKTTLARLNVRPPALWDDLGEPRFYDLLALADPTQSGSAAASYEMIVQSAPDWPVGWAKLLSILSNAKRFYDGASGAADAVISEAPVATCIDFYGVMRVARYPEDLVYVSPEGQTAFSPDPIGILANPPHPELAQRFVDFVLSARGQALWAVRVGEPNGPAKHALMRQPIRKDVYSKYADRLSPWIINPYKQGKEMQLDVEMRKIRFGVLKQLVRTAAIDNFDVLKEAKQKLIETNFEPSRLEVFNRLPPNVASQEQIADVAEKLTDATELEKLTTGWQRFFRDTFERVAH